MSALSSLPPDISSVFSRFSKEELHQIGLAFIEQSQQNIDKQQQTRVSGLPRRPPQRTIPSRPSQQSLPLRPPLMNHQQQEEAVPKVRPLMEQQHTPTIISTPRRSAADSFDYSGEKHRRTAKRFRNNEQSPYLVQPSQHAEYTHNPAHHHFNFNVLKRAVSSNLPCFFISFDHATFSSNVLSSIQVAIMLKKMLTDNQIAIKELSMCTQAGAHRFKFAVNDKADFLNMHNFIWPNEIEGIKVVVDKPRSLPDCFSLVVRYIPVEINVEQARSEISKAIPTAVAFSKINYQQRQRPTYDLRFSVLNLEQYETSLELGRLAIGHYYLPLTHFYTGYRLTYCTACWRIDHTRNQCQSPVCCRRCLSPYENGVKHICSEDNLKCAQCDGDHFSLDPRCPIIKTYKIELKRAVDNAVASGSIRRTAPGETSRAFQRQIEDFPSLKSGITTGGPGWHSLPTETSQQSFAKEVSELVKTFKAFSDTMNRFESLFEMLNKRIDSLEKSNSLHNNSITTIIDTVQIITKWLHANNSEKTKLKKST
jgi:hypothetical protein